jgi:hypothetical protein
LPPWQVWVGVHAVAHPPQWSGSALGSTQASPHAVNGLVQPATHAPLWQNGVAPLHALPHAPQFAGSLPSSTHAPLQTFVAVEQAHLPATHAWPLGQALPQAPQLVGSLVVSTHFASHFVRPTAHAAWQAPFEQTRPLSQAWPHEPQFEPSFSRSTQAAPHALCPFAHVGGGGGTQSPALQVSFVPQSELVEHATCLPPQLATMTAQSASA